LVVNDCGMKNMNASTLARNVGTTLSVSVSPSEEESTSSSEEPAPSSEDPAPYARPSSSTCTSKQEPQSTFAQCSWLRGLRAMKHNGSNGCPNECSILYTHTHKPKSRRSILTTQISDSYLPLPLSSSCSSQSYKAPLLLARRVVPARPDDPEGKMQNSQNFPYPYRINVCV